MDINPSAIKESLIIQRYPQNIQVPTNLDLFVYNMFDAWKNIPKDTLYKKNGLNNCDESHGIPIRKKITV